MEINETNIEAESDQEQGSTEQETELDFELSLEVLDLKYGAVERRH